MITQEFFQKNKVAKNFVDALEMNQSVPGTMNYKFKNELGSQMTIEFRNGGGLMTGTYKSGVSDPNTYPLTGYVSGNVIAFIVNFTKYGSICAWAGQAIWNQNTGLWEIPTLWHLVEPTPPSDSWEDTYAGSNIFTQIK